MSYQLKLEKIIARPVSEVFRALSLGKLFMNCGAASDTLQIDFRIGGKYLIQFRNKTLENFGEFLEIVPDKKIVFSWCQEFGANQQPDTQVSVELFDEGAQTKLILTHAGFKDKTVCDQHEMGWTAGLVDMAAEIQNGQLRFLRSFDTSLENLFQTCQSPASFFGLIGDIEKGSVDFRVGGTFYAPTKTGEIKGSFLEIIPNQTISLSWLVGAFGPLKDSQVTLNFKPAENGNSKLELLHDGLFSEQEQMAHRSGWEELTRKMAAMLAH
ncbi:MAG: SRPBCC domain-containing protein [Undibacterium sp.]|nr:SRPBCC domain-containing protein [Undibacterium sp.]